MRERDSLVQITLPSADVVGIVKAMVEGTQQWSDLLAKYPAKAGEGAAAGGDGLVAPVSTGRYS
jgi:hypothetical protein